MNKKRIALVGYGCRGSGLAKSIFTRFLDRFDFVAVCDKYEDRATAGAEFFRQNGCDNVLATQKFDDVLTLRPDAIIVTAAWEVHIPFAIRAMEAGITVGIEVGGAYTIEQCFDLVATYERTHTPFMFFENCNYGRLEQMALHMKNLGVFGDIVHCEGGYLHDLREEVCSGNEKRHYRFREYATRNCDNYPTHEFGPIMRMLDIGNGNRPVSLVSMASKAVGLSAYAAQKYPPDHPANHTVFAQGDVVTTLIRCARGETITLTLSTTLPRYYSRGFTVQGTRASLFEDTLCLYADGEVQGLEFAPLKRFNNIEQYYEKYESPLWRAYASAPVGSHGGMDYLIFRDFFERVIDGGPMPVHVYDAAFMMAVTPLSAASIAAGSTAVEFPDFCRNRKD